MSESKDYLEDLKNLKPLPPEMIPVSSNHLSETKFVIRDMKEVQVPEEIIDSPSNNKHYKEVSMDSLKGSKTLWGFGIAVFIYIVQHILIALNIAGPDNLIVKSVIEVVIAVSGFFGVYGVRDALRKMG